MPKLTLGFISAFNERVEPLMNGTVKVEGIELIPTYSHPAETFWRQLKFGEFEVAEMSMSSFLIAKSQGADMAVHECPNPCHLERSERSCINCIRRKISRLGLEMTIATTL